ncbi:MAG TPA: hypothetical protein VLC71_02255 [Thermomonas sp.]|nr:hypothetical protein [Thermomonas sp.]
MAKQDGGWSDQDLLQSIHGYVGSGYNQDAPEFARFCHAAAKIIRKRRQLSPDTLRTAPTVFLMAPVPSLVEVAEHHPMFDRARAELAGKVWFGAKGLSSAAALSLPKGTDVDLFNCIVTDWSLGNAPAIYFDSDDGFAIRIYPKGMGCPDECELVSLDGATLTLDNIHFVLDAMHRELLETPSASDLQRDLWAAQGKWWPINESEKGIQKILHVALKSHLLFSSLKIDQEHSSLMGRCDFILKEQDSIDPTIWTHHAILELKVVKKFTHTGSEVSDSANKTAVSDGLDQARDYRKALSCRLAALCCYDMRKKPDPNGVIEHEKSRAEDEGIGLWAWPIYNKVKAVRARNRLALKRRQNRA